MQGEQGTCFRVRERRMRNTTKADLCQDVVSWEPESDSLEGRRRVSLRQASTNFVCKRICPLSSTCYPR